MQESELNGERILRFHALYAAVFKDHFDRAEFEADDLYAFQAFERALRSEHQELRNLAAHLQAQRQAAIESITLKSTAPLDSTRKLSILSAGYDPAAPATDSPAPVAGADGPKPERRSATARLTPQEIAQISNLQRLYRKEFARNLDITRFALDDSYGRAVIKESLGAADQELVKLARHYVDENGKPRLHRRRDNPTTPG